MNKTGTWEWANWVINIQRGCEHDCRYCYARYDAVHRFHYCTLEQWRQPEIITKRVERTFSRRNGITMFPSSHDITPHNIEPCMEVLHKLLAAGNRVLIVSKPHWPCVTRMCEEFKEFRDQILFRFTIGSTYDKVLEFWEPGAPNFAERISALQYAFHAGYQTSVSCEPYLDAYICQLVEAVTDWVTETIWIGRMNKVKQRVDLAGVTDDQMRQFVVPMLVASGHMFVMMIVELLKDHPQIRWKDSIRAVIASEKLKVTKVWLTPATVQRGDAGQN